jgi:hypothetical protein
LHRRRPLRRLSAWRQIQQDIQARTAATIPVTEALGATLTTARRFGCDKCGTKSEAIAWNGATSLQRATKAVR